MKTRNLFVAAAIVGLLAGSASAQVDVKPGGTTVTGPAGNNLTIPFNGQTPTVAQPGTSGTFTPGINQGYNGYSTYPSPYYQGTQYPGYSSSTFPGYQVMPYGTNSFYTPYGTNGYSYYTPGGQMAGAVGGGCCGAVVAAPMYAQVSYGGDCGCQKQRRRGLFRR